MARTYPREHGDTSSDSSRSDSDLNYHKNNSSEGKDEGSITLPANYNDITHVTSSTSKKVNSPTISMDCYDQDSLMIILIVTMKIKIKIAPV